MRDPLGPIPSPVSDTAHARRYWEHTAPPLPRRAPTPTFDPLRLLDPASADGSGIDRRGGPRAGAGFAHDAPAVSGHDDFDVILGLRTRSGWALVHGLSRAPSGILVRVLDPVSLEPALRPRIRTVMHQLAHADRITPLSAVSRFVLSPRVVADLKALTQPDAEAAGPRSCRVRSAAHHVTLVVPGPHKAPAVVSVRGEVVRLADPTPGVLAIALDPSARADLDRAVRPPSRPAPRSSRT